VHIELRAQASKNNAFRLESKSWAVDIVTLPRNFRIQRRFGRYLKKKSDGALSALKK